MRGGRAAGVNSRVLGLAVVCNPTDRSGGVPDADENCVSEEAAPSASVHLKVVSNFLFLHRRPKRGKEEGQQAIPACSQHSFPQTVSTLVVAGAAGGSASPAPALRVVLATRSSLPAAASPAAPCPAPALYFLPFNKHLVGRRQLPGEGYSPRARTGSSNFNSFGR